MKTRSICTAIVVAVLLTGSLAAQGTPAAAPPSEAAALVKQGRKLSSDGKQAEAMALYQQALQKDPKLYEAHLAMGVALDLEGKYAEARKHIQEAIDLAPADRKPQAWRTMAMAYAFAGDGQSAARYQKQVLDARLAKNDYEGAAEIANEGARLLLETGQIDEAEKWYRLGYENAQRKPNISDAEKNLWLFRWENAQARIAARRGNKQAAQKHVDAAKAALDKANEPEQLPYFPYLTGYVAFYAGDMKSALAELEKANQGDPFVLSLMAQAHEKLGHKDQAMELYKKVLGFTMHNPNNAFARPLAQRKLQQK